MPKTGLKTGFISRAKIVRFPIIFLHHLVATSVAIRIFNNTLVTNSRVAPILRDCIGLAPLTTGFLDYGGAPRVRRRLSSNDRPRIPQSTAPHRPLSAILPGIPRGCQLDTHHTHTPARASEPQQNLNIWCWLKPSQTGRWKSVPVYFPPYPWRQEICFHQEFNFAEL